MAYVRDTDLKAPEMTRSSQRVLFKGISGFASAFPLVLRNGFQSEVHIRRRWGKVGWEEMLICTNILILIVWIFFLIKKF